MPERLPSNRMTAATSITSAQPIGRARCGDCPWRVERPIKVLDGVVLGNFDVVEGGIYYIDRVSGEAGVHLTDLPSGETRLQYFEFATGRSTTVASNLGIVSFGLSASRDGRTVFFSRVDSSVDELMLVENFR